MTVALCVAAAMVAAALCLPDRRSSPRRRPDPASRGRMLMAVGAVAVLPAIVLAGPVLVLPLVAVPAGLLVRARRTHRAHRAAVAVTAPLVGELLAGCVGAGVPLPAAVAAVGAGLGGEIAPLCRGTVALLEAGATPQVAWQAWLDEPSLAPLAATLVRSDRSGAAVADALLRTALRLRAHRRAVVQRRVRTAGVLLVLPLGTCFLPAFVAVGVVPLVLAFLPTLR